MREVDARNVLILVEGLPETMQNDEVAYAIEVYVKTRLVINHNWKILPLVGLPHGDAQETVRITVVGDFAEFLRRVIAVYSEESLRRQCQTNDRRALPCEFQL